MTDITDLLSLVASNVWLYGGTFLLVLGILVIVHEWGHYIIARACGVRVEEFSVGFGPRLFGWRSRSGTEWKVCLVPMGGYVKMFGDTDPAGAGCTDRVNLDDNTTRPMTEVERNEAFFAKRVWQRAAIVFAGPAINYIFAILLLAGLYVTQGKQVQLPLATAVHLDKPGAMAGIIPGDRVVAIDGRPIQSYDELRRTVVLALDTPLVLTIDRQGKEMTVTANPERLKMTDRFGFEHERGYLGVFGPGSGFALKSIAAIDGVKTATEDETRRLLLQKIGTGPFKLTLKDVDDVDTVLVNPSMDMNKDLRDPKADGYNILMPGAEDGRTYLKYALFDGMVEAVRAAYQMTADGLFAMGQMISGVRSPSELGGIIRIGAIAGDMASQGFVALVVFTALLSINLGLINLFPIPMLDGGHLMFYAVEAVRGTPIPERMQEYAFRFGLVVLVFFMVFANLNDIMQLIL